MTVFNTAIDTIFNDINLSVEATYTPVVGVPSIIRAVVEHNVELVSMSDADVTDRRIVISVRKSEIAAPARGDTLLIGSTTHTVDCVIFDDDLEIQVAVH